MCIYIYINIYLLIKNQFRGDMHEAEWENGGGVGPNVEAVGGVHPGRELRLAHGIWQFYLRPTLFVCIYICVF